MLKWARSLSIFTSSCFRRCSTSNFGAEPLLTDVEEANCGGSAKVDVEDDAPLLAAPLRAAASRLFFIISARPPPPPEFVAPSERALPLEISDVPLSCLPSTSYASQTITTVKIVPIGSFLQVASWTNGVEHGAHSVHGPFAIAGFARPIFISALYVSDSNSRIHQIFCLTLWHSAMTFLWLQPSSALLLAVFALADHLFQLLPPKTISVLILVWNCWN